MTRKAAAACWLWTALAGCEFARPGPPEVPCETSATCPAAQPVCEQRLCVVCTAKLPGACTGDKPVCKVNADDPLLNTCTGCTAHAECTESAACLPTGACAASSEVAYVSAAGSGSTCSKMAPCALSAGLSSGKSILKLSGAVAGNATITDRKLTFLGDPGAQLRGNNGSSPVISVGNNGVIEIYDLELTEGQGAMLGAGISVSGTNAQATLQRVRLAQNSAHGATVANGGKLTLRQCTVRNNGAGGLKVDGGRFDITNTFFHTNGAVGSTTGGVSFANITTNGNVFAFNTITGNGGGMNIYTGVSCVGITQTLALSSNIIYGNQVSGAGAQVGGAGCEHRYSIIGPDGVATGTNQNADPRFLSATDFHIGADSPARNSADPGVPLTIDFDGQPRPQPASSSARDIGADEVP